MIKINVSEEERTEIKEIIWKDETTASTGLLRELQKSNTKNDLMKYSKLYNTLYDNTGDVNMVSLRKLLLSDKSDLMKYIDDIGEFDENDGDKLIKNVFKFDNFAKRKSVIQVLSILNADVCPYCNRQYITTIKSGKVRAQLDHFFPKKKYPYLALSIFNLIPCCSICNTSKSNLNTVHEPILYPYEDEFGYDVAFGIKVHNRKVDYVKVIQGTSDEFDVIIKNPSGRDKNKIDKQIDKLHLDELYNTHKSYIEDLLQNKYINTSERIRDILKTFPALFKSEDEIKNVLYMSELRKENWHQRPLSKLTHDIDKCIPE